jgi:hypothetical protein
MRNKFQRRAMTTAITAVVVIGSGCATTRNVAVGRYDGIRQREELADSRRLHFPHGLEQPLDDGAKQFLGFKVQRRLSQTWITSVQKRGA